MSASVDIKFDRLQKIYHEDVSHSDFVLNVFFVFDIVAFASSFLLLISCSLLQYHKQTLVLLIICLFYNSLP